MLCSYMCIEAGVRAYEGGYTLIPGNPFNQTNPNVGFILYVFYLSKILDFLDTAFIIFEKRWKQLSFLHVYHHTSIFLVIHHSTFVILTFISFIGWMSMLGMMVMYIWLLFWMVLSIQSCTPIILFLSTPNPFGGRRLSPWDKWSNLFSWTLKLSICWTFPSHHSLAISSRLISSTFSLCYSCSQTSTSCPMSWRETKHITIATRRITKTRKILRKSSWIEIGG